MRTAVTVTTSGMTTAGTTVLSDGVSSAASITLVAAVVVDTAVSISQ